MPSRAKYTLRPMAALHTKATFNWGHTISYPGIHISGLTRPWKGSLIRSFTSITDTGSSAGQQQQLSASEFSRVESRESCPNCTDYFTPAALSCLLVFASLQERSRLIPNVRRNKKNKMPYEFIKFWIMQKRKIRKVGNYMSHGVNSRNLTSNLKDFYSEMCG